MFYSDFIHSRCSLTGLTRRLSKNALTAQQSLVFIAGCGDNRALESRRVSPLRLRCFTAVDLLLWVWEPNFTAGSIELITQPSNLAPDLSLSLTHTDSFLSFLTLNGSFSLTACANCGEDQSEASRVSGSLSLSVLRFCYSGLKRLL